MMNNSYKMYKDLQVAADINKSSKKQLLLMMYDAVINNISDAINAIKMHNLPTKIQKIDKTLSIIELGLMMSLSKEGAKDVAENLELFYEDAVNQIVMANLKNDATILENIKSSFFDLRKCWEKVAE